MERTGTPGAIGRAIPGDDDKILHFPADVVAAKKAQIDATTEAWEAFTLAYRHSLTVGSVNSMRATVEAFAQFEALAKGI